MGVILIFLMLGAGCIIFLAWFSNRSADEQKWCLFADPPMYDSKPFEITNDKVTIKGWQKVHFSEGIIRYTLFQSNKLGFPVKVDHVDKCGTIETFSYTFYHVPKGKHYSIEVQNRNLTAACGAYQVLL